MPIGPFFSAFLILNYNGCYFNNKSLNLFSRFPLLEQVLTSTLQSIELLLSEVDGRSAAGGHSFLF